MDKKILLGLTTTRNSDWRTKVKEINEYNIRDIALFLTGLEKKEREELYRLLAHTNINSIYHVHLRGDMDEKEISYLIDTYDVQAFNIHSIRSNYPFDNLAEKFYKKTYIENTFVVPTKNELLKYGGLCVDFSHWESYKWTHLYEYYKLKNLADHFNIGCCHVSAIRYLGGIVADDQHIASDKKDFDYLKKYIKYLPNHISLELENSFKDQLEYKKYIQQQILI